MRHARDERIERPLGDERRQRRAHVGSQPHRQPIERRRVRGRRGDHLGAEAQRVLERVEALEEDEALVRARGREGLRDGVRSHGGEGCQLADADYLRVAQAVLS